VAGEPRRRRAARARAGGVAARARCARHRGLGVGLLPRLAGRAGGGREGRIAPAAHLQSAARLTAKDEPGPSPRTAAAAPPATGAIPAGVGGHFAILPRLRGRGPRTLLVATALDDIPARPPTVTPDRTRTTRCR